jgi:2-oxoglutarate ferredoxin oxidoreductase subunit delta
MAVVYIDIDLCKNCSLCMNMCPKDVFEPSQHKVNKKGYNYMEAPRQKNCIKCMICEKICPDFAIHVE